MNTAPLSCRATCFALALLGSAIAACSSSPSPSPGSSTGLTCASPGEATPGPADTHCVGQPVQPVDDAMACFPDAGSASTSEDANAVVSADAGDDAGDPGADDCDYGATMFGGPNGDAGAAQGEGDDDDCKYHVRWTTTGPICPSATLGVTFIVTVTNLQTGLPVTDIPTAEGVLPEAFLPTTLDAACDDMSTHLSPTAFGDAHLIQTTPTSGVYQGQIIFDAPGEWTVRFHIHEECSDLLANSPHGHAAFHVTVP